MRDLINRADALRAIDDYRAVLYSKEGSERARCNRKDFNENAWQAAYKMQKLYDAVYKLIPVKQDAFAEQGGTARQVVDLLQWAGETHTCSSCGKIVPFVDWGQPYCSGCGAFFENYAGFCKGDTACDGCLYRRCNIHDGERHPFCGNGRSSHHGELETKLAECADFEPVDGEEEEE